MVEESIPHKNENYMSAIYKPSISLIKFNSMLIILRLTHAVSHAAFIILTLQLYSSYEDEESKNDIICTDSFSNSSDGNSK
jgi:hypothetical protein